MEWIRVENGLPNKFVDVIVYSSPCIFTAYMKRGRTWWSSLGSDKEIKNVTHWMRLPEPPK